MRTLGYLHILISLLWTFLFFLLGLTIWLAVPYEAATTAPSPDTALLVNDAPVMDPAVQATADLGKRLFKNNCGTCHNRNMTSDLTGPALAGVRDRWADFPKTDLLAWVRNSLGLVEAGHPRAVEVYETWKKSNMPAFHHLSDADIEAILVYVDNVAQ